MSKLVAVQILRLPPGTHEDGRGLRLIVRANGTRFWVLRYQLQKRRRDLGLGPYPEVTLARAREKALEARRLLKDHKLDPLEARKGETVYTFREAAEELIEAKKAGWRNAKHAAQWTTTLTTYVYPKLGDLDVREVSTERVLEVLKPIWTTKPETASRVRQRIEAVIDGARAAGRRSGDNPAAWKGHLASLLPHRTKVRGVKHHAALPWQELPGFMAALAEREGTAAKALLFAILTAARSGEVRGMTWAEVDMTRTLWTIPGSRMKAGKEHIVPLSTAALAILDHMLSGRNRSERSEQPRASTPTSVPTDESGSRNSRNNQEALGLVFPNGAGEPLSDMALAAVLKRMGRGDLTAHGFRSTFRDWAGETTAHPREVIEHALAHRLKDKAEAAYARGDLLTKRRKLMDDWATFATSKPAEIINLHTGSPKGPIAPETTATVEPQARKQPRR